MFGAPISIFNVGVFLSLLASFAYFYVFKLAGDFWFFQFINDHACEVLFWVPNCRGVKAAVVIIGWLIGLISITIFVAKWRVAIVDDMTRNKRSRYVFVAMPIMSFLATFVAMGSRKISRFGDPDGLLFVMMSCLASYVSMFFIVVLYFYLFSAAFVRK
ncbi:MAG: hypothetical protein ACK4E7_07640 [Permianibacter sp.]